MLDKGPNGSRRLKLDVAVGHGKPRIIAEGVDSSKKFPVPLLALGFKIDIAQSEASRQVDRQRILNCVCDVDPAKLDESDPPTKHPKYEQVAFLMRDSVSAERDALLRRSTARCMRSLQKLPCLWT